jgi:cytochrome P450
VTSPAAWTLCTYADVHAALRDDRLAPYGVHTRGDDTHTVVRDAVAQELPAALLNGWRVALSARAVELLCALPTEASVDLVADFAEPWAREAAQLVLGVPAAVLDDCMPLARALFEESAVARSGAPSDALSAAASRIAVELRAFGGAGTVQSFVALTQTVPALVSSAFVSLLQHPEQLAWLRAHRDERALATATNELLRFAGPSRAVYRTALSPVAFGDSAVDIGDEVVLLLSQANRDPARFRDPDVLDLQRSASGHLAFGAGTHGCVGASIVRLLLHEAMAAFVRVPRTFTLTAPDGGGVTWLDGFALCAPRSIAVDVREAAASTS